MFNSVRVLCFEGCGESEVVLSESEGTFGVDADQYVDDMSCVWKTQVDPNKVSTFV